MAQRQFEPGEGEQLEGGASDRGLELAAACPLIEVNRPSMLSAVKAGSDP